MTKSAIIKNHVYFKQFLKEKVHFSVCIFKKCLIKLSLKLKKKVNEFYAYQFSINASQDREYIYKKYNDCAILTDVFLNIIQVEAVLNL